MGVGNGDPTSHESDIGSARKAFSGLCMAIVQSRKLAGEITVEATSPGLKSASVTISGQAVKLRPQTAVWEREIPTGAGITGLWRPAPSDAGMDMLTALFGGGNNTVFTLRQNGNVITGKVESPTGMFGGGGVQMIEAGQINDGKLSFRAGSTTYSGTVNGDHIELNPSPPQLPAGLFTPPSPSDKPRPAIGPPPDGTDPSFDFGGMGAPAAPAMMLRRAKR